MKNLALLILLAVSPALASEASDTATCALQVAAALPHVPGMVIKRTASHIWKEEGPRRHGKLDIDFTTAGQEFSQTWYCTIGVAGVVSVTKSPMGG